MTHEVTFYPSYTKPVAIIFVEYTSYYEDKLTNCVDANNIESLNLLFVFARGVDKEGRDINVHAYFTCVKECSSGI